MSIDHQVFLSFANQITKLGFFNLGQHLSSWARTGWSGTLPGAAVDPKGLRMVRLGQGLQVAGTVAQLPGALKQQDPTGQGRSRFERMSDVAGQTAGGLVGAGAAMSAVNRLGLQAGVGPTAARVAKFLPRNAIMFGLPTAAALGVGHLLSAPSRAARLGRIVRQQRELGAQDNEAPAAAAGLRGSPATSPMAQEGQQGQMR